jgi:hypothetical protein
VITRQEGRTSNEAELRDTGNLKKRRYSIGVHCGQFRKQDDDKIVANLLIASVQTVCGRLRLYLLQGRASGSGVLSTARTTGPYSVIT